jgi:hypothetical protein
LGSDIDKKSAVLRHNLRSLGHVSGYHMAVVAGVMFFAFRALFALMPAFSSRHPIKKWVTAIPRGPRLSHLILIYRQKSRRQPIPAPAYPTLCHRIG